MLLTKAVQNEQEARDMQRNKRKTKKVKVGSDMSIMKPSELLKMAADDRIRGVLYRESSSKGKRYTKMCERQELHNHSGLKTRQVSSGWWEERRHVLSCRQGKDSIQRKEHWRKEKDKQMQRQTTTHISQRQEQSKEGKAKESKNQSFTRRANARRKQERFHRWRAQQRANLCMLRRFLSCQRARHIRCFISFTSGTTWRKQFIFWIPELRSVCRKVTSSSRDAVVHLSGW